MRVILNTIAASFLVASPAIASSTIEAELSDKSPKIAILEINTQPKEPRFICKGCNEYEMLALNYFQDAGIRDRNALATILGNIKQESTFVPNICEGGSLTKYHNCRVGGYGLIQFTSIDRYQGLGTFARKTGGDPSSIQTQLQYMTTEPQWKMIEQRMKATGKPIDQYMRYAYSWIGWGIHGSRTYFAHEYAKRLVLEVNS